jgi:hypothetical protein
VDAGPIDADEQIVTARAAGYPMAGGEVERDPLTRRHDAAPPDDERVTAEDLEAMHAAREDFAAGRVVSLEEVRRELEPRVCVNGRFRRLGGRSSVR